MSGRYEHRFGELEERGHKAFVPFTVLGWPEPESCVKQVSAMVRAGVSALELGFPFSDPVADGPIIQQASHQALAAGFTVDNAFSVIEQCRESGPSTPIGVLVYYNMVLAQGVDKFFKRCRHSGVDGVLIADLPIESAEEVLPAALEHDVRLIYIVSPVTTPDRLELICKNAGGFLYLVSRLGVTGTGERDTQKDQDLSSLIQEIRTRTSVPVCAGFGISTPEHAQRMFDMGADGVITGSRVIDLVRKTTPDKAEQAVAEFCKSMLKVCSGAGATV
jgi:tryptophan synthase alpha chain